MSKQVIPFMHAGCAGSLGRDLSGWASMRRDKKKEDFENRPERSIQMSQKYPGVEVPPGQAVTMNLIFDNKGRTNETWMSQITSLPKGGGPG